MSKANYQIDIRVIDDTDESPSPIAKSNAKPENSSGEKKSISKKRIRWAKALGLANGYIKPFVDQITTNTQSLVSLRTGAQELEERITFRTQALRQVWSFGSSIVTGALLGGAGGAVIGGVISGATTAIDLQNKQTQLSIQKSAENVSLRYMNVRAGGSVASFSGSRMKTQ